MPPSPIQALFQQALAHHRAGRLDEAEKAYRQIIRADPRDFPSRCMLGRLRLEQGRNDEAVKVFEAAVRIDGRSLQAVANYGVTLLRLGKHAAALDMFNKAAALDPRSADVLVSRADTLLAMARPADALADCDAALVLAPDHDLAMRSRAAALVALERNDEAIDAYGALRARAPGDITLLRRRVSLLLGAGRFIEALADCDAAPRTADFLTLRGAGLCGLRRFNEAIASHDAAIAADPNMAVALFNRGAALESCGHVEEALESYDRALAIDPDYVNALNNRSGALIYLRRFSEAKIALERVLTLKPDFTYAYGSLAHCLMHMCDWSSREAIVARLRADVVAARGAIHTMTLIAYIDDPELQLACARTYAAQDLPRIIPYDGEVYAHEKIRLAYVSSDFHDHATARLAVELFERHDRARFEVIGISFGPDDESPMRQRVIAAFDQFHDVRLNSDDEIAALIRTLEIDIAIDLKGFTHDSRPGVFARRPAPIQVTYLGFPGTSGADCFDYVLADEIVAPVAMQPYFSEQIVHLSGCYQPNDSRRALPSDAMSRREAGLPDTGFVFCCFNNNFKIAPAFFDVWMRLLRAVDGSVLWLIDDNAEAVANLRKEAAARGVDPARLVFAPRVEPEAHLARHAHADLFLDTLPYGAHTTASDALWMGVPVLTCLGRAFAGRVGASLCHAVGLDDLVMADLAQYEQAALALARDPARLAAIKARLITERSRHRLFDSGRHCRTVEAAFVSMIERQRHGDAPKDFRKLQNAVENI